MKEGEFGPWRKQSPEAVRSAYKEHVKANGRPETFPGIRPAVRPPPEVKFEVIYDDVALPRNEDTRIPCNLCGTKNKFCGKGLLFRDEFGWPYLGGAVCGRRHFGVHAFDAAVSLYNRRKKEELANDFLFDAMYEAGKWTAAARNLMPAAEQADAAIAILSKQQTIFRRLKQIIEKDNGQLLVYQTKIVKQANGKSIATEIPVKLGELSGGRALSSAKPRLLEKLDVALKLLEPIGEDTEQFFDTMAKEEESGQIVRLANLHRREVTSIRNVHAKLMAFQEFFSTSNFEQLRSFGSHELAPIRFGIEVTKNTRRFLPSIQRAISQRIRVDLLMKDLPKLPESLDGEYAKETKNRNH